MSVDINVSGGNFQSDINKFIKSASEALKALGVTAVIEIHDSSKDNFRATVNFSSSGDQKSLKNPKDLAESRCVGKKVEKLNEALLKSKGRKSLFDGFSSILAG